jgi:hypothetical protein
VTEITFQLEVGNSEGLIRPLGLSTLAPFSMKVAEVANINAITASFYMKEFLLAIDEASRLHATAVFNHEQAKDISASRRSIATLDKAPDGLREKGMRVNEEFCKQFAMSDLDYLSAREAEAYWKAMVTYLEMQVKKYQGGLEAAKSVAYQTRDPRGQSQALPSGRDAR